MLYVVIFACSFIAFGISVVCGGGAGLILLSVLNRFLPVIQVPAVLSIGTSSSSFSRIVIFYKDINWKIVRFFYRQRYQVYCWEVGCLHMLNLYGLN
ncbi:hypothetical protein [Chryseobacterium sp. RU37D]|uniref:hypothetical protein n=1 Tax=Chryseobacterium sp. RU37D TaxID=1907397 RepID=UPI001E2D6AC0|nr:hypothetical protein [Chryseobacterium sp. RU37D]